MINKQYYKQKRVVVAGGGGFLGSHICAVLQKTYCKLHTPRQEEGIDFRRFKHCESYFQKVKPDIVINCAANQGGIGYHKGKETQLFMDNIKMGLFLMEAAQKAGVKKFTNIIAGCSYPGYLEKGVLNEEDYWKGPIHDSIISYGFARKASVVFGSILKKQYAFASIHLILANMYGPGESFHPQKSKALAALIKKFYDAKKNNLPTVEIWGTGKPIRDWLYVEDGAMGILKATECYDDVAPLNIASGKGVSIRELARVIQDIIGYQGEVVYNVAMPDGALKKTFSTKKMEDVLQWKPETTLKGGIAKTIAWLDAHYDYAISR